MVYGQQHMGLVLCDFYAFIKTNVLKAHVITEDCFSKDTF